MTDYIALENGMVIDTDGVIIEAADINDAMKFLAEQRHDAKQQAKEWEHRVDVLDTVILKNQAEKKLTYGETVIAIRGGTYTKTDPAKFAEEVYAKPIELEDLFAIIAAATGFKKDLLPEVALEAYQATTTTFEKRPWVESSVARRRAAEFVQPADLLLEKLDESLAVERAKRGVQA
jgi:hypothetical protein